MHINPSIVVIDKFLDEAQFAKCREVALAESLEFHPDRHKGRRGPEVEIASSMREVLALSMGKSKITWGYSCFQLCIAGEELVYHCDGNDYAAVLFLTPNAPVASGTSFFKSKATGIRSGREILTAESEQITFGGKLLDRTAWEEVDRIGNLANCLVIWDARLVHSATDYFGDSIANGRLFQMFFFNAE